MKEAGDFIEAILAADQNQEAWKFTSSWYRQASGGQAPPSREHLDQIATERADLYRCRPPEGIRVPIMVTLVAVDNRVMEEGDI